MKWTAHSVSELDAIAKNFSSTLKAGDVIALYGDLGAGKTTFTQGIASSLGFEQTITSPTFTILQEYVSRTNDYTLAHIDTYRCKELSELIEIGIQDYLGHPDYLTVIEWPELLEVLLPQFTYRLYIKQTDGIVDITSDDV